MNEYSSNGVPLELQAEIDYRAVGDNFSALADRSAVDVLCLGFA